MIRYKTINFLNWFVTEWPGVGAMYDVLSDLLGDELTCINGSDDTPDIVFVSSDSIEPITYKCPHLFVQAENPLRWAHRENVYKLPQVGYIWDDDSSCNMPDWYYRYDELRNPRPTGKRINRVCSMFHMRYPHREDIINHYNADRIKWPNKIKAISHYAYNIAVENSYAPFYITEKLTEASAAGCIPIYKGGDLSHTPFNQERIITPYDPLPLDPSEMLAMPILNDNAASMRAERREKLREFLARVL